MRAESDMRRNAPGHIKTGRISLRQAPRRSHLEFTKVVFVHAGVLTLAPMRRHGGCGWFHLREGRLPD
ncbi:hypothetical protein C7416_106348 [Cupriavidus phytorum]|uniref:Uncharacterized protein n=1 Tax=Cupriavidus phytorum TaxID=3024399 RepID=A0A2W7QQZ2_9BURK|nr:hypothetical protein C7416_106348 [Cupriavidus alkaliphilus]